MAGFGGVRDYAGRLSFRPRLPEGIERLSFSLEVRGTVLRVTIGPEDTSFTLSQGDSVRFSHWDEEVTPGRRRLGHAADPAARGGGAALAAARPRAARGPVATGLAAAGRSRRRTPFGEEVHFVGPSAPHRPERVGQPAQSRLANGRAGGENAAHMASRCRERQAP